jgi:hypothetical protein
VVLVGLVLARAGDRTPEVTAAAWPETPGAVVAPVRSGKDARP